MANPSTAFFVWMKAPNAYVEDDHFIVVDKNYGEYVEGPTYYPAEHSGDILNTFKIVQTEEDVINFVKEWGFLESIYWHDSLTSHRKRDKREEEFNYIVQYLFHTKKLKKPLFVDYIVGVDYSYNNYSRNYTLKEKYEYRDIEDEVAFNLNLVRSPETSYKRQPTYESENVRFNPFLGIREDMTGINIIIRAENVHDTIKTAQNIRDLSTALYLKNKYENAVKGLEDYYIVEKEASEWMETNPDVLPISNMDMIKNWEANYSRHPHEINGRSLSLNEYKIYRVVEIGRLHFSSQLEKEAEIYLHRETGQPAISFLSLRAFIFYTLLSEPASIPERCLDPKCNQLFFPSRKGQRYCPPLAWETRSRCEQRHGKALRRAAKKKNRED